MRASLTLLVVMAMAGIGCRDCDRSGCEAMNDRASSRIPQGIAGTVASQSDMVVEQMGQVCNECPLAWATVGFWRIDSSIRNDSDAQAWCEQHVPEITVDAHPRYQVELAPGHYLICTDAAMAACDTVDVVAAKVTTVNILLPFGYPAFYIAEPGGAPQKSDGELFASCTMPDPKKTPAGECPDEQPFLSRDGNFCVECLVHADCGEAARCNGQNYTCSTE